MPRFGFVTLMTDFGERDHYVGAVKGSILSINPDATILDITHDIAPHDVKEAAFTLLGYASTFPFRTTHMVIVDPGVGTAQKPLLVVTDNYYYLAPDNGVLSYVLEREEIERIVPLEEDHFFRKPVSPTFHARDIYGSVAGWLSRGDTDTSNFGPLVDSCTRWEIPKPRLLGDKLLKGHVLHIDRFGNIITNISREQFEERVKKKPKAKPKVILATKEIPEMVKTYGEGKSPMFFLFGSTGFLEIASRERSVAESVNITVGKDVGLMFE
ncbi:MAG: SAM-dependent chlorinase/fluorinase [Acidobacteriota bacterium]|nr:MAG: SAM-dependent chlorinase/fluorinase [Acidobacteriota bacterium]